MHNVIMMHGHKSVLQCMCGCTRSVHCYLTNDDNQIHVFTLWKYGVVCEYYALSSAIE